jgi:uncharacterized cupredoxin-like copper-binding protein
MLLPTKGGNEMGTGIFRLRRTTGLLLLAIVAGLVLVAGCSGSDGGDAEADHDDDHSDNEATAYLEDAPKDQVIAIAMSEFHFGQSAIEVEAGQVIELAFTNDGTVLHDFTIERMHADVHVTNISGAGDHAHMGMDSDTPNAVHIALDPGGQGLVHLKAEEGGEFVFYCSVPGHREGGMVGTLTVLEGDGHADDDHAATDDHDEDDGHDAGAETDADHDDDEAHADDADDHDDET